MTPSDLLTLFHARGVRLSRQADRLVIDAPAGLVTADDRRALAEHKDALIAALDFDTDLARLVFWFGQLRAANCLPPDPFLLVPWVQIVDPERFYAALEGDIAAGPRGPRARFGGLADSLRRLRAFVERQGDRKSDGKGSKCVSAPDR